MESETKVAKRVNVRDIVLAAMFTALGLLYPQIFHLFGSASGQIFSPMHIPVLLCGFVCGRHYGAICGVLTPVLSFLIFTMPPVFLLIPMALELAMYGFTSGLIVKWLHPVWALLIAMLAGRIVYGLGCWAFFPLIAPPFPYSFEWFLTGAFVTVWPGIVTQIVAVPLILIALQKAKAIYIPTLKMKTVKAAAAEEPSEIAGEE